MPPVGGRKLHHSAPLAPAIQTTFTLGFRHLLGDFRLGAELSRTVSVQTAPMRVAEPEESGARRRRCLHAADQSPAALFQCADGFQRNDRGGVKRCKPLRHNKEANRDRDTIGTESSSGPPISRGANVQMQPRFSQAENCCRISAAAVGEPVQTRRTPRGAPSVAHPPRALRATRRRR
jgi:hypothetical protein